MKRIGNVHHQALERYLKVREELGIDLRSPLQIIDMCQDMGLTVRSVD